MLIKISLKGVPALFDLSIDGDYGADPDFMALWASQSDLGLPAKVSILCLIMCQRFHLPDMGVACEPLSRR